MNNPLRIGMIGLDTSHVIGFTELLNNPDAEHHVPGGRVVAVACSPKPDPDVMRVSTAQTGKEILDDDETTPQTAQPRADHRQAA